MVIIFDADGTLIDTYPLVRASYIHTFKTHLPDYKYTESELESFFGPPLPDTFKKVTDDEDLIASLMATYQNFSNENAKQYLRVFPYTKETLVSLKTEGHKLVVLSNKIQEAILIEFEIVGIIDFFDKIIGYTDVENPKPHPEGVEKIQYVFQDHCIFVGDSVFDMQTARNARIKSVGVTWALTPKEKLVEAGADYLINDFRELYDIVRCENV